MNIIGTTLYPRINRKPGMDEADVLEETDGGGVFNAVSKGLKFGKDLFGVKTKSSSDEEHVKAAVSPQIHSPQ